MVTIAIIVPMARMVTVAIHTIWTESFVGQNIRKSLNLENFAEKVSRILLQYVTSHVSFDYVIGCSRIKHFPLYSTIITAIVVTMVFQVWWINLPVQRMNYPRRWCTQLEAVGYRGR